MKDYKLQLRNLRSSRLVSAITCVSSGSVVTIGSNIYLRFYTATFDPRTYAVIDTENLREESDQPHCLLPAV